MNIRLSEKPARMLLAAGLPAAIAAVGLIPYLALRSELPDRIATHFDGAGVPDGSMAPGAFRAVTAVMFAVGAAMTMAIGVWARPLPSMTGVGLASLGGFLMGLAAGILVETVVTQRGLSDWTAASLSWPGLIAAIVAGIAGAAIAARLAAVLPALQPKLTAMAQPTMSFGEGEHAVWSSTLRSSALTALGVATALVSVVIAVTASHWSTVIVVGLGSIAILALASIRVRADGAGLTVGYGVLPWPKTAIAVERIASAAVIDVQPKQWGGWGYRGSLKLMKQAAVVLRAGPGIRLDLHDGKVFVVTVDHPENAVALLNGEIARQPLSVLS